MIITIKHVEILTLILRFLMSWVKLAKLKKCWRNILQAPFPLRSVLKTAAIGTGISCGSIVYFLNMFTNRKQSNF